MATTLYYSAARRGFYDLSIHGEAIPADAVAITAAEHAALLAAQAAGKLIQPGEDGHPVALDPPAAPDTPAVPAAVQLWQARVVMRRHNILAAVQAAAVAAGPEVEEWLEYGAQMERAHPRTIALAHGLGLTEVDLDALFVEAAGVAP